MHELTGCAEKIPNCEAEFIKSEGHFWVFEHLAGMLEKLVNSNWSDNDSQNQPGLTD